MNFLNQLHENNIIHRNLKQQNIILDITLIGFGISLITDNIQEGEEDTKIRTYKKGTIPYLSPETLSETTNETSLILKKSDVWSFGCVVFFIFTNYSMDKQG